MTPHEEQEYRRLLSQQNSQLGEQNIYTRFRAAADANERARDRIRVDSQWSRPGINSADFIAYRGRPAIDAAERQQAVFVGDADVARQRQYAALANSNTNYDAMGQQLGVLQQAQSGNAPSVAAAQQQAGLDSAIRAQMAAAQSGPGFNAASQVGAAQNAQAMQLQAVNSAAQLRAAEMAQARADTNALLQARGTLAAGQQQLALGGYGAATDAAGRYGGLALQNRELDLRGRMGLQAANLEMGLAENQHNLGRWQTQEGISAADRDRRDRFLGALISGGSALVGAAATSDETSKEGIEDADEEILGILKRLDPKSFRYKPEAQAAHPDTTSPGVKYGVMAQDLERSGMGSMVGEAEDGTKLVDTRDAAMAALAGVSALAKKFGGKRG